MSFDNLAAHYGWMETLAFGGALQRARTFWIPATQRPKRALIVGEGNGRFLCELLRVHPKIDIDCVDASRAMLKRARSRVERNCRESLSHVRFLHRDILDWSPSNTYDLLVTHFFLDCFERSKLETIVTNLARAARAGAIWLLADFTIPTEPFARLHATAWTRAMYAFFRVTTGITATRIVDPAPLLTRNGFVRTKTKLFRWQMLKSEAFQNRRCQINTTQL